MEPDARATHEPQRRTSGGALALGTIVGISNGMTALVTLAGQETIAARTAILLTRDDIGAEVVVWRDAPVAVVLSRILESSVSPNGAHVSSVAVACDGERLVLSAAKTITLRCGAASITLHSDGAVIVEGARITSRAIGVNRLSGAAVHIN